MKPTLLVIFGFTGDLVSRYFLPALYHLELDEELPDSLAIMATTRREVDLNEVRKDLESRVSEMREVADQKVLDRLFERIELTMVDITNPRDYPKFKEQIEAHDQEMCKNRLFYFAVPPGIFGEVLNCITESGIHECGDGVTARLLIEKPFGHDTASAKALLTMINRNFGPEHVYPIDHYMAKETVQNLLFFRFKNPLLRAIWNGKDIKQIQISILEEIDIQGRKNFYENVGATKDMLQSHALQLAALVTMAEPEKFDAKNIRLNREQALKDFKRIAHHEVQDVAARAQYEGYRDEVNNLDSLVETFFAVKLEIDNDIWKDTPIYIRSGKAMDQKLTEITLIYNDPEIEDGEDNVLTMRIQPNEGFALELTAKKPGLKNETQKAIMDYCYEDDEDGLHGAYEKILVDALMGDQTLFASDGEILNNWELVEPLLDVWHTQEEGLTTYKKGAHQVNASHELLAKDGNHWITLPNICVPRGKK